MPKRSRKIIKKILVATDFSQTADFAVARALDIAKAHKARVVLLHVAHKELIDKVVDKVISHSKSVFMTPKERAAHLLDNNIKKLSKYKLKIKGEVVLGIHPAMSILEYAKRNKFDLLVMGNRGKYALSEWLLGTTADYVAKNTPCPTLIVKKAMKHRYNNIIIPVDFSSGSKSALLYASTVFKNQNIRLLHVGNHEFTHLIKGDQQKNFTKNKLSQLQKDIVALLSHQFKSFIKKINGKLSHLRFDIELGYPGKLIVEKAKKLNQDLIVMGTQGHTRSHYVSLGRVAAYVLLETDRDVLLVP